MEKTITITENNGIPHLIFIDKQPSEIKAKKLYNKNGYYISTQMGFYGLITSYWKNIKTLKDYTSKKYHNQINEQI
tara:strand:+ start:278 stop:505 length:228 start_codon:yes stop_codon:yes gene_type:complete